jgi:hypothetical protein
MPTTNVKIFTGFVQQEQLAQDMGYLKRSLNKLRSIFATRGVRLRTDQCDTNDPEQIRESVADSDAGIFLFQTDVPDLARAQFDAAYAQLVSGVRAGSPSIFVWFRDVDDTQVSDGLREFQAELDRDMGHFFSRYSNVDTVQFQLLLHLEREGAGVPFTCAGTTLVDARGNVVMDFTNTAAYLGNEMLRSVRDRRRQLEERYDALLERELEVGLDEKESGELDELVQQIADIAVSRLCAKHFHFRIELTQKLPAGTAWHAVIIALSIDGNAEKVLSSLADGFAACNPFGTDRVAIRCVFHVAPGEHGSVFTLQCCPNGKFRIWGIGMHRCIFCDIHQFAIGHGSPSFNRQIMLLYI